MSKVTEDSESGGFTSGIRTKQEAAILLLMNYSRAIGTDPAGQQVVQLAIDSHPDIPEEIIISAAAKICALSSDSLSRRIRNSCVAFINGEEI